MRRGRPSLSPQAPSPPMPETLQAITHLKPPSLLATSTTNRAEEDAEHSVQPGSVSAAAVAKEVAEGLPVQASSSSQLGSTAVSVSVSVQDNPAGASAAQAAPAINPQGRPTLLPHSAASRPASTPSPGPLVPSVLRDLAAGQGLLSQPQGNHGRQHNPCSPAELEDRRNDPQATVMENAPGTTLDAQISAAEASVDMAYPAGSSGQREQAPALESALTEHNQDPPSSEAGVGDPDYNLKRAISHQFESLPGRTPPGPKQGPHRWPPNKPRSGLQPKPETAAPDASMHATQDVPGTDPSLSHVRCCASPVADRLISDSFDRLGQGSLGGEAGAPGTDRHSDSQLQPDQDPAAGQDNDTDAQQQNQDQGGDMPMQAGTF